MTNPRLVECAHCDGERGHAMAYGVDYRTGDWLEYWVVCDWCRGTGEEWIEADLITADDLDQIPCAP